MDDLDLAGLLVARLCHDLAGPIGVVANGAELLADEDDAAVRTDFTRMMGEAAVIAAGRLRFYRLTLGAVPGGQPIAAAEAVAALADLFADGARIAFAWTDAAPVERRRARLALLLAQIAGEALGQGGRVTVASEGADGRAGWRVEAHGAGARLSAETIIALGPDPVAAPRQAPPLLAARLARAQGFALTAEQSVDAVVLVAR